MRATWVIVFVCTTAAADDGWRYKSRADGQRMTNDKIDAPPEPPLAIFTKPGTLYMMTVDAAARPRCEAWTIDPIAKTFTGPSGGLALVSEGAHLQLGAPCTEWASVRETDGDLEVDGSTWFRDRGACMRAVAAHRPVATDLGGCIKQPAPVAGTQIRARLDRVLARGGTLFAIVDDGPSDGGAKPAVPRCEPVRADGRSFHHDLVSTDLDGHPIRGETTWQYHYRTGDDEFSVTDGSTSWSNGSGFGMLCAHHQRIAIGPDWVDLGDRYYLSAASCHAAIANERELASWFVAPRSPGPRGVGFGGC
jgi:hypothetical protein